MTACDRFETEGLARFVAGEPPDSHLEGCPDCQAGLARYQKVAEALREVKDVYDPPGDWEAKVWARLANEKPAPARARWPALFGLGAAFAALAAFFLISTGGPDSLGLTSALERGGGPVVRGGPARQEEVQSAAPGDVLHLVAKVPRGKLGDLRVYRGANELVFDCATSPACLRSKDGLEARVTLERAGTYRTLLLAADSQLPAATSDLDADYAAALRAGTAKESAPIEVL